MYINLIKHMVNWVNNSSKLVEKGEYVCICKSPISSYTTTYTYFLPRIFWLSFILEIISESNIFRVFFNLIITGWCESSSTRRRTRSWMFINILAVIEWCSCSHIIFVGDIIIFTIIITCNLAIIINILLYWYLFLWLKLVGW